MLFKSSIRIFLILFISCFQMTYGQAFDKTRELVRMTHSMDSPEASAFMNYGNNSVNLYTGTPNISVPIFTYPGRELSLPLSLTYDASGIKVQQEATNAGLGWNLNATGRITRIVNGLPDDYYLGSDGTTVPYKTIWDDEVQQGLIAYLLENKIFDTKLDAIAYLDYLRKLNDNEYDALPDFFSINAFGYSDMIVIDVNTREARALNNPRTQVSCHKAPASGNAAIMKWTVTTDDGTTLIFDEREITKTQHFNDNSQNLYGMRQKYNSSWLLTKVISPKGKDIYEFSYVNHGLNPLSTENIFPTSVVNFTSSPDENVNIADYISLPSIIGRNDTSTERLQQDLVQIKHNQKVIVDVNLKSRFDLNVPSAIDQIKIWESNELYQSVQFHHSYFKTLHSLDPTASTTEYAQLRLKLDSIVVHDRNQAEFNSFSFDYFDADEMPRTDSFSQDYYGYYNGRDNTVLYPTSVYPSILDGADRSVDFDFAIKGTLKKITYPTGGFSEFEFGPNRSSHTTQAETQQNTVRIADGVLNLTGGQLCDECWWDVDSEFNGNSCIGGYTEIGSSGPPHVTHQVFYIDGTSPEYLLTTFLNSQQPGLIPGQKAILFKRTDVTSTNPNFSPSPLTYDEIYNCNAGAGDQYLINQNDVVFYRGTSGNYDIRDQSLSLSAGFYQVTLVNPQENSFSMIRVDHMANGSSTSQGGDGQIDKAGLRVQRVEDYADDNTLSRRKEYSYSDGTVISQPFYSYVITDYTVEDFWGNEAPLPPMLYRNSHSSATSRPHMGYSSVVENIVDFNNAANSIANISDYNTTHWGSYFAGVYTYFINNKESVSNYGVTYNLGKTKSTKTNGLIESSIAEQNVQGTKYVQTYEYDDQQYYQNSGIYPRVNETRNHLYPVAMPHPNHPNGDKWYINYLEPELVPSLDGSIATMLGDMVSQTQPLVGYFFDEPNVGPSGPSTIYYRPPSEYDSDTPGNLRKTTIGRLDLQISNSFGKAGYMTKSTKIENFKNGGLGSPGESNLLEVKQETRYSYYTPEDGEGLQFLLKTSETTTDENESMKSEYKYPHSFISEYTSLKNNNILSTPVQELTYKGRDSVYELVYNQKQEFDNDVFIKRIQTAKASNTLETRIDFERYRNGNLTQASVNGESPMSYIWGYDNRYIVAKVENVSIAEIEALPEFGNGYIINEALTASQETALRSIQGALVTSYNYEPLIGITKITDPKGYSVFYEYDAQNRLEYVKDQDGNILSRNEYNFKN